MNSTAIQWRMNMSTLGEVVWSFFRGTRSNRSAIRLLLWLFAFTTGKTGCKWSHDYSFALRQILCVFLALLRNCEQYNKVPL